MERATKLTPAMLRCLEVANDAPGIPVELSPLAVAEALQKRGFILPAKRGHPSYPQQWFITPRGRTALRISKKEIA